MTTKLSDLLEGLDEVSSDIGDKEIVIYIAALIDLGKVTVDSGKSAAEFLERLFQYHDAVKKSVCRDSKLAEMVEMLFSHVKDDLDKKPELIEA